MGQNRSSASPLESLFGGGLFERFFGDAWPGLSDQPGSTVRRLPQRRQRSREAVDLQSFLNQAAMDRLQAAAEKALQSGRDEVDTEHLLHALADHEVVQEILRDFKLDAADLKQQID
ncbi:MAG: Clp protease N-terminal domain-containing protein, partial [Burkholderiaceae bacterium]